MYVRVARASFGVAVALARQRADLLIMNDHRKHISSRQLSRNSRLVHKLRVGMMELR